jgi:hypothetical protein
MPLASVPHAGPQDQDALTFAVSRLEQPGTLVVRYASKDLSPSPIRHELIDEAARIVGVELRLFEVIQDRQGRKMFHVYSLQNRTGP